MSPTASHSVPTRCVVALSALAMGIVVVAAVIALRPVGAAAGAPTTTTVGPSASTSSIVTTQPLLRGSPAPGANQTTTTVSGTTGPDNSNKTTHSTNYKVWGIVAALIAVALIIAILTWVYWQRTRPDTGSPSQRHRSYSGGNGAPPGSVAEATEEPAASASKSVKPASPSGKPQASTDAGRLRDSDDPRAGRDTRDHTTELPVAAGDGDRVATERAARESPAAEQHAEGEPQPGKEFADERRQAGENEENADEPGLGGLIGRLRSNRSRYADIVITVPHPDDLRHDPS